jgi:hypothetical protein
MRRRAARISESSKNIMYMVNRSYNCLMGPQTHPAPQKKKIRNKKKILNFKLMSGESKKKMGLNDL